MITGTVFCGVCNDFQSFGYADIKLDPNDGLELHSLGSLAQLSVSARQPLLAERKRKREPFKAWKPSPIEKNEIQKGDRLPCDARRGLLNLGATCYMSVILQCLLHNPLVKNYFLSDKHNNQLCGKPNCMCCELDQLFRDVFSTPSTPPPEAPAGTGPAIGPLSLLRATWENSKDIAGNTQQDAHEFFISLLNQLHLGSGGVTHGSCTCMIHQIFAGQLQSDVKCGKCGYINPTIDPMLDINLELKGLPAGKTPTLSSCLRRLARQASFIRASDKRQVYRARETTAKGIFV